MNATVLRSLESPFIPQLKSRVAMSAMTRGFADPTHCATDAIRDYYENRARHGVGLILTEGVVVHPSGDGYNSVPHIATREQAASWKPIVEAVQRHGTRIYCQLWHCGRISHSDYTGGVPPVSSTNRAAVGMNRQNNKPFGDPLALDHRGITLTQEYFVEAACRALDVGFDGVELHLGHGYLADQFFDARVNDRQDEYGGSVVSRCRYSLDLIEKVLKRCDARQVSIRISPSRFMGAIYDWPDLEEMLDYFIPAAWSLGIRILDISCANADYFQTSGRVIRMVRPRWAGVLIGGASLSAEQANAEVESGLVDVVTWGRSLIANPDLPERIKIGAPWTDFSPEMLKSLL